MHGKFHEAFDTTGAFLDGGRWHSAGTRVVYAAEHAGLAVLETLIHAGGKKLPPRFITRIHILGSVVIELAAWIEMPDSQRFGDRWVEEGRSAVLRVPSLAVHGLESNFVFNPAHTEFKLVKAELPTEFVFDPRFFLLPRTGTEKT